MPNDDRPKIALTEEKANELRKLIEEMWWKVPHSDFFYHLGFAVNKWANIDKDIFTLFRFALNVKNDTKAALIYYEKPNISDHFRLTDILIRIGLNKRQLSHWEEIAKEFNRLSAFRNRLAHDPANSIVTIKPTSGDKLSVYYELNLERTKLLRALQNAIPSSIRVKDIEKHSSDLEQLQVKIALFLSTLPKRALKRVLRPLSARPQPKAFPSSAAKNRKSRNRQGQKRQPRSSLE